MGAGLEKVAVIAGSSSLLTPGAVVSAGPGVCR